MDAVIIGKKLAALRGEKTQAEVHRRAVSLHMGQAKLWPRQMAYLVLK